jgi:MFS family permease
VLEILSLRLIAPYVGLTLETSTAVIGMALAAIATGAWLGGRFADVIPPARILGPLVLGGGIFVLTVLPVVRWTGTILRGGDQSAVLAVAAAAVFAPAALLSAVSPVVVKIRLSRLAETGTVVGRLSGIGTLGAIAATFGTGFVLISMVPTSAILLSLGAVLVLAGIALAIRLNRSRALAAPVVLALVCGGGSAITPATCDLETAYHCARVVTDPARPSGRQLELDTLKHSYVDVRDPRHLEYEYVRAIASAADVFRPDGVPVRALHLGAGGLTIPRYLAATRPGSTSLVLEIDAGVLRLNREKLPLPAGSGIQTRAQDARIGVAAAPDASRDLVVGDAFGGLAVPWHLTTRELVRDVRRVLTGDGIYAVNVIDYPPLAFARAELATIAAEFADVAVVADRPSLAKRDGGNFVILASRRPLPIAALRARLATRDGQLGVVAGRDGVARFADGARPLTDEFAPVDQLLTTFR